MIPVEPQPEPDVFDQLVRIPGKHFLRKLSGSKPTYKQWKYQDHWKHIRFHLYKAYHGICAYSAHWIPCGSTVPNIDHFIPKSVEPELAYEWGNYRLAGSLVNALKRDWQDVLDPFTIEDNWFYLHFPSLMLHPNPELSSQLQQKIWATIDRLQLNDNQTFVEERSAWLEPYCRGKEDFSVLKKNAPFIAYELERQNLVEHIKTIMIYDTEEEF